MISLNRPDHRTPVIGFAVEARHARAGQEAQAGWQGRRDITLAVTDVDEAPQALALRTVTARLAEDAPVDGRRELARLVVSDPDGPAGFRQHHFTLSGADAALFEIVDGGLYLSAGAARDQETAAPQHVNGALDRTRRGQFHPRRHRYEQHADANRWWRGAAVAVQEMNRRSICRGWPKPMAP